MKTTRLLFLGILGLFSAFTNLQAQTATGYATSSVTSFGLNAGVTTHVFGSNSFYGYQAGNVVTNIANGQNSFFGAKSGKLVTSGTNNTLVGYNTGSSITTGSNNNIFGANIAATSTGSFNNVFGGGAPTIGTNNCLFGGGGYVTTGSWNTFIGSGAGPYANSSENVCVGANSMNYNTGTVAKTIAIGYEAGAYSTGSENLYLGYQAGKSKSGSNNIFIGNNVGESSSNKLNIDNAATTTPLIWGDFAQDQVKLNGKVGIGAVGTFPTMAGGVNVSSYRLFVTGGILANEVRVNLSSGGTWADYVFNKDYDLKPLAEVEKFIADKGHLPNVPSAKEVNENGIALGEMAKIQQEKIEELTLYLIQQNKEIESLKAQMKSLLEQK